MMPTACARAPARSRASPLYRPCLSLAAFAAWAAAGLELFSGVNVPSKAFGEFVEHASKTPSIGADELDRLMRAGADMVVLDSRPFDEYSRVSIPTATNVPGAELVLRVRDLAPSPATLVVVNCAGRTRSIIGAQSLINAGVPNKVVALRNGGWVGSRACRDSGQHKLSETCRPRPWLGAIGGQPPRADRRRAHRPRLC
jgi:rhodanese-related sulfurtransferase